MARQIQEIDYTKVTNIAADAALNSYGVVAIANRKVDKDQPQKTMKGKAEEGIFVKSKSEGTFALDVYLLFAPGIKITEALRECQKTIKFKLDKQFPKLCREVNVYAVDISAK